MKKVSGLFFVRKDVLGVQCPVSRSACVTARTRRAHTCVPGRACHCMHLKENLTCVPRAAQTLACMACKATRSRFIVNDRTTHLRARARRLRMHSCVCTHATRACTCVCVCECVRVRPHSALLVHTCVCTNNVCYVAGHSMHMACMLNDVLCGRRVWINACKFVLARACTHAHTRCAHSMHARCMMHV